MHTFKGTTVLITGASSGIGAAMARQLVDPTTTLLLTARSADALQTLATEVTGAGGNAAVFPHDLSTPGAAETLLTQVEEAGFTVDVLINNAGFGSSGPFHETSGATYAAMIGLNITELTALTHRVLPGMVARGGGAVLNVASTAAFQPIPFMAVYAATKSYVLSFSEALHAEYADRNVVVTCLCPGITDTGFQQRAFGSDSADAFGMPVETPEQVAKAGLRALLHEEMTHVSGTMNRIGAIVAQLAPRKARVSLTRRIFERTPDNRPS